MSEKSKVPFESNATDMDSCKNCGEPCDMYIKPALHCSGGCDRKIHVQCLKHGSVPSSFIGDVFFELNCSDCNSPFGNEVVTRDNMSWFNIVVLTLYNLREKSSGISKRGYFHWKSDISTFVDRNWNYLFKKTVIRKKNWIGTISGTLSHYNGIFFKSGTSELGESGWWRLIDNDPPEVLIARNGKMITNRKKQGSNQLKAPNKRQEESPTPSESSISVGEDSNCGGESFRKQGPSMYSRAYVQPSETLFDFLLADDDVQDMDMLDIDDSIELNVQRETPSFTDLMKDFQYQSYQPHQHSNTQLSQMLDNFGSEWSSNIMTSPEILNNHDNNIKEIKNDDDEEQYEENSSDGLSSVHEQLPVSLFNVKKYREWPWEKRTTVTAEGKQRMSEYEEAYLLQKANKCYLNSAPPAIRRFYRKLALRKLKRERGLSILDVDRFGLESETLKKKYKQSNRVLDRFVNYDLSSVFEVRLQGYNEPTSVHSPYTNRLLKPYIRRDTSCRPLWLRVMEELCAKANKTNPNWKPSATASVDYSYVRPHHIPAINSLCNQFFWPGIDLTECLQYPDFSCVVLYKKLVIGFAVLVPDVGYNEAYISFFLVRPEWRKAGIGTFMLYHLIQTCMGKDLTLHVSATNPAIILYQKFGFKIEEFIQDFYDKFIPPNSQDCRHALFLRLSR